MGFLMDSGLNGGRVMWRYWFQVVVVAAVGGAGRNGGSDGVGGWFWRWVVLVVMGGYGNGWFRWF